MLAGLSLLWLQLQLSMNMTKVMDLKADPCTDFYQYACGNYGKVAKIEDDKSSMNRFQELADEINLKLRGLLEENITPNDTSYARMTKQFYKSCTNTAQLEKLGLAPLKTFFQKYGGWPVVDGSKWNESKYDWMTQNARFVAEVNGGDILSIGTSTDFKNSSKNTLSIDQVSLGLRKRELYLDEGNKKYKDAYFNYMLSTAVQLGAPKDSAEKEVKEALEFETALANISVRDEDRRDNNAVYRPMTIKELKEKYPKINFDAWFKKVGEAGWKFQDTDVINLSGQPYLDQLDGVLSKYPKRTLANFQMWKAGIVYSDSLAPSLRENYRKFREATGGAPKFPERWEECVEEVSDELETALGAMYVTRYFSQEAKEELDNMVTSIRKAMALTIESITWMDENTKLNAHKKLESMIQMIAFPSPDIYNETWVMRDYAKASIKEDAFLENKLSLAASSNARSIREFRDALNRTEWRGPIAMVNAWYSPEHNTMTFPAGILQPSWYHPFAPDYYNYGHIGTVMGHELTHGFDDQGRQYDDKGTFNLWWSDNTLKEFESGAKCFIEQYGNITDAKTKVKLNGENTQGENIADNGGLKLAFKAFQEARKNPAATLFERNRILPRMSNFTADQLYFLSFGQAWCNLVRDEYLQMQIVSDPHSPAQYRVNVPLQNNADFAQAYKCAPGSPMNPAKKCQIW